MLFLLVRTLIRPHTSLRAFPSLAGKGFLFLFVLWSCSISALPAYAAWDGQPYAPGATLDPECGPSDSNCKTLASADATTLEGRSGSYYLANSFSTTSAAYFLSDNPGLSFATTSSDYWLAHRSTSDLPEGSRLYYTDARADARILATTTLANIISLPGLSLSASQLTGFGIPFYNFFHATTTDALAEGSLHRYYSDVLARGALGVSAGALAYDSGTGILSVAGGYTIPLSASTTEWGEAYDNRITSASAPLTIANREISLGIVDAGHGGTGLASYNPGALLYADADGNLTTLSPGSSGTVLKIAGGVPTWGTDLSSGGGGGAVAWATTSDSLAIYPMDSTNVVIVGASATSSATSVFEVHGRSYFTTNVGIGTTSPLSALSVAGSGFFTGNLTSANITATGTLSVSGAGTSTFAGPFLAGNLAVAGLPAGLIKAGAGGYLRGAVAGTDYFDPAAFGSTFYSFFHATTTDALAEGSVHKYWSDTLFDNRLSATTSLPGLSSIGSYTGLIGANNGSMYQIATSTNFVTSIAAAYPLSVSGPAGAVTISTALATTTFQHSYGSAQIGQIILATSSAATSNGITVGQTITNSGGVFTFAPAVSVSNIPNAALQNSAVTVNGTLIPLGGSGTVAAASSTLLGDNNTFSGGNTFLSTITGSVSGNAGTVTNGVYTTTFGGLFDNRLSATTSLPGLTAVSSGLTGVLKAAAGSLSAAAPGIDFENPLSFLYPLARTANSVSLAFGTTTSNTWGGTQTFTNNPILGTLTGLFYGNNGSLAATATSSVTSGTGIGFSGTPGALVGGTPLTITNTGVTSNIAGTGISVSGATGAVTISAANVPNSALENSTIGLASGDSSLTVSGSPASLGGSLSASLNTAHPNTFTALQQFSANASTTGISSSYASSTKAFLGSLSIGNLTGILRAAGGAVSASLVSLASDVTGVLGVINGGTGWDSIQSGSIPYGNGAGALATTSPGTNGQTLALVAGVPAWIATTTAGTGLTYSGGSFNVNTAQNVAKLSNLTGNGFVKTINGDGTLSVDTNTYLASIGPAGQSQSGPAVAIASSTDSATGLISGVVITGSANTLTWKAVLSGVLSAANGGTGSTTLSGILKGNGTGVLMTAVPGTDYQAAGNYLTALTGDISASGPGSAAATLATVNADTGSFGGSTAIPTFVVNGKGLVTSAGTAAVIAPAGTLTGTVLASNILASSLTSVGTLGTLSVSGQASLAGASSTAFSSSYASSTSAFFGNLSVGSLSGILRATAGAVSAGAVNLASEISGMLGVANGGTGAGSFAAGSLIYGNGTGPLQSAATSSVSNGAGISVSGAAAVVGSGGLTITNTGITSVTPQFGAAISNGGLTVASSTAGTDFSITGSGSTITFNLPTASAANRGLLSSADWSAFSAKQGALTFAYPLQNSANTVSLAFGTTTANTWGPVQTFTNVPVLGTLSGIIYGNNGSLAATATSTLGVALADTTGSLPVDRGGTGSTTLGGILKGNGTSGIATAVPGIDYQPAGSYLTGNQTVTLSGDVSGSGATSITTAIGAGKVTNAMLLGAIAAAKLIGTDITTVGTIVSGVWQGSVIGSAYGGAGAVSGILKANGSGNVSAASAGTDYVAPNSSPTFAGLTLLSALPVASGGTGWSAIQSGSIPYGNGSGALATTSSGAAGSVLALVAGVPAWVATTTFSTGLTYTAGSVTVNTAQSIAKLSNLTSNGFVKTINGDGTLSVDTNTYLASIGPAGQSQSGPAITIATSTAGTDISVTASGNTITFNLPTASAANRGLLSSSDWTTFNGKVSTGAFTSSGLTLSTGKLLGRSLDGTGAAEEITVGSGLSLSGGTLSASGSGISALGPSGQTQSGATVTIATSTSLANGVTSALVVVGSSNTLMFTPSVSGVLTVPGGGTGAGTLTGLVSGNGTNAFTATANGANGQVLAMSAGAPTWVATTTFSTGLTYTAGTVTVNTVQSVTKLSNLATNGFVKTINADGTLSIDTNTYLTSALTSIGPAGQVQNGPAIVIATSTTAFNGITVGDTITGSGNTLTWKPSWSGSLSVPGGGTGATSFGQGWIFSSGGTGALAASTSPTVNYLIATSTTAASIFNYRVGIGTNAPATALDVNGDITIETLTCNTSLVGLGTDANGKIYCKSVVGSDERLKSNIESLGDENGLALIDSLRPVSYDWKDPNVYGGMSGLQYGFIAQQALSAAPTLVGTTSPTELTPDVTYTFNYFGLIAPLVKATQQLDARFGAIASTSADASPTSFAQAFFGRLREWFADAANGIEDFYANRVHTSQLCLAVSGGEEECFTGDELKALKEKAGQHDKVPPPGIGPVIIEDVPPPDTTASSSEPESEAAAAMPVPPDPATDLPAPE
ncbi:MAG: tail fiber domain-containing protein [bacterium]